MRNDNRAPPSQRIVIAGGAGSGKSTLARALHRRTNLPAFHMDQIHWKPGWTERIQSEKSELIEAVIVQEKWILEGNHSRSFDTRMARAQLLVWLDLPVSVCMFRVVRRTIQFRGQTRPDLPADCPDRLDAELLEFLKYIWQSRHRLQQRLQRIYEQPPAHLRVVRLKSSAQIDMFIDSLSSAA